MIPLVASCLLRDTIARSVHSDLAGNVWEWTRDWSADYVVPCVDCQNTTNGDWHILRGGGYGYASSYLATSFRFGLYPGYTRAGDLGFRCARQPQLHAHARASEVVDARPSNEIRASV